MEVHPPETQHPNGFAIKTIEGFGENKDYWRIADNLVRGSRLFRHLCLKIYRVSSKAGINRKWRIIHMERYKHLMQEFGKFERDASRIIRKLEAKNAKQAAKIKELKAVADQSYKKYRDINSNMYQVKKKTADEAQKVKDIAAAQIFLTKRLHWKNGVEDEVRAEIMLRSVFAYEEIRKNDKYIFIEMIYLATGTQLELFSRDHIKTRFGEEFSKTFRRDINRLIEVGFIRKFERKQLYYLTLDGKNRFKQIMSTVYSKEYGLYWADIFKT